MILALGYQFLAILWSIISFSVSVQFSNDVDISKRALQLVLGNEKVSSPIYACMAQNCLTVFAIFLQQKQYLGII